MTAYELSGMLNITVSEAQDFIDRCDCFDRSVEALYDLEPRNEYFEQLIEEAEWEFDFCDDSLDD
jgi:hypothetical protein